MDGHGRISAGAIEDGDVGTGWIYVLRSRSQDPTIREHRDVIHKIGVTGGDIRRRLANARLDPTFLMADVEIVATYELANVHRSRLENLIHKFFEPARLSITITDRFGNSIVPREWFLVPLHAIDDAISKIRSNEIVKYKYDLATASLALLRE